MFCLNPSRFGKWEGWDISRMWKLLYRKEAIKGSTLCFVVTLQFKLSGWSQQKYLFDNIQYFKWSTWSPGMMESKERLSDISNFAFEQSEAKVREMWTWFLKNYYLLWFQKCNVCCFCPYIKKTYKSCLNNVWIWKKYKCHNAFFWKV